MQHSRLFLVATLLAFGCPLLVGCSQSAGRMATGTFAERVAQYAPVRLTADLSGLSASERAMIPHLRAAAEEMDRIFWIEAYGDRHALITKITDPDARRLAEINYGPWDRLGDLKPFIDGVGEKPAGSTYYPTDMTKEEFEKHLAANPADAAAFKSEYTVIRRDAAGRLVAEPFHVAFAEPTRRAVEHLRKAAALAEDPGLKRYLELRATALETSDFRESDMAWLDMKENGVDLVIGPIETYEDKLFGYKAAHEAYVLVKDKAWSARLARYAALLPDLQRGLPVPDAYKTETPGSASDLNAYDALYYAGDCNAGSKTIAINLPNDEQVQLAKGTRRLQIKNAMRAKYDHILVPIADQLVAAEQRKHITFDAFFGNVMFHEVAHGLGIKNTINGRGTVRDALKELAGPIEEAKADVLGLHLIGELFRRGELTQGSLDDHYVTYLAGLFRSVRFGAASAHGRANMLQFNFYREAGAFVRDPASGTYRVVPDKMGQAVAELAKRILVLQGDGDAASVEKWMRDRGVIEGQLAGDLARIARAKVPVDIVFEQ